MSIKFEKVVAGMTLYDCHSQLAGNTTIRRLVLYEVRVISVDSSTRSAMCSWNGNPARRYSERKFAKLSAKIPPRYLKYRNSTTGKLIG